MDVFVYGTLLDPHQALAVVPDATFGADATLHGVHAVEGEYPTLAPGGTVEGQLLTTEQMEALDRYEGVDSGLYVRVSVPTDDGRTAEVYVGDPDRLDSEEAVGWPGDGTLAERVERYVDSEGVVVQVES
ncbi:gamma-glutamylcyclotransferase family protein [Halorarius halobius]|uniref:gamma-glutamylcyclotransferase family protein n=1 Tax=Halorarius halobius TaxID=2962671 RepID=UPI0020CF538F|nr:gamma-glutamylcyclotransferase family protein [Halorarius halobius]